MADVVTFDAPDLEVKPGRFFFLSARITTHLNKTTASRAYTNLARSPITEIPSAQKKRYYLAWQGQSLAYGSLLIPANVPK